MKVLLINGSPRENGNTFTALSEVAKTLNSEGIDTEIISIGKMVSIQKSSVSARWPCKDVSHVACVVAMAQDAHSTTTYIIRYGAQ